MTEQIPPTDPTDLNKTLIEHNIAKAALYFPNINTILVPKKSEYNLKKYASKKLLKKVDSDINVAVEKCLVFLSNLASTYYTEDRKKSLHSTILHDQSKNKDNAYIYTKIIDVLVAGTKRGGAIIKVETRYEVGSYSKQYSITDSYFKVGLTDYILKDVSIIQRRNKLFYNHLKEIISNVICSNLINIYGSVELPTVEEIKAEGRKLVKSGYKTNKGKLLTMRNKHTNSYWNDVSKRSFVEDNIALFEFLTKRGFMLPTIGDDKSGGRIVDSFTLMPSWIRKMIKFDGHPIVESDYSCLHPNLASKIYGGTGKPLRHEIVSEYLKISRQEAKIEHLSFFNKEWSSLQHSPLYSYYFNEEPTLMENMCIDKAKNGYISTTTKVFRLEVEVMSNVIKLLNNQKIYVLYVYDAIYCKQSDKEEVNRIMNLVAKEMGINTLV